MFLTPFPSQKIPGVEHRKRKLAKLARSPHPGIVLNEFFEGDGDILFEHACKLGCEGIVSKRLGSLYRSIGFHGPKRTLVIAITLLMAIV